MSGDASVAMGKMRTFQKPYPSTSLPESPHLWLWHRPSTEVWKWQRNAWHLSPAAGASVLVLARLLAAFAVIVCLVFTQPLTA